MYLAGISWQVKKFQAVDAHVQNVTIFLPSSMVQITMVCKTHLAEGQKKFFQVFIRKNLKEYYEKACGVEFLKHWGYCTQNKHFKFGTV